MENLNVSLPVSLKDFIDAEVASGRYNSASDYLQYLVQEAQKRKARQTVDGLLIEGLESGEASPMTKEDWQDIRREVRERSSQEHRR